MKTGYITTDRVLRELLLKSFGRITIDQSMFYGTKCEDPCIPMGYFSTDRLKRHSNNPINKLTVDRLIDLFRIVLGNKSKYSANEVSSLLCEVVKNITSVDIKHFAIFDNDDAASATNKKIVLIDILRVILNECCGKESIQLGSVAEKIKNELQVFCAGNLLPYESFDNDVYNHGVFQFCFRVLDANYPEKILAVHNLMEIIHFHGLSWVNNNYEFIRRCLTSSNVVVRVGLLNPESPFLVPFADFIQVEPDYLRQKIKEAFSVWKKIYIDAENYTSNRGDLYLYTINGFPAKSIYRFDDAISVTPSTNAQSKSQFMSYWCQKVEIDSAFDVYCREIEWLFDNGSLIWSSRYQK